MSNPYAWKLSWLALLAPFSCSFSTPSLLCFQLEKLLYSGCHFHAVPWLWEPPQASPHMLCLNTRPPTPTLWTAFQSLFWALSLQPHFSFCACNMHTVPYMPDLTPTHPTLAEALQSFSLHLSTPQSCSDHSFPLHNSISIPCCDRIQHFLLGLN